MKLIAKTFFGLESVLENELKNLGARSIKKINRGVEFEGDKGFLYKANLSLRTALEILMPVHSFTFDTQAQYYTKIYEFEWSKYLDFTKTFAINFNVYSKIFTHSQYASLVCKDAIVDHLRNLHSKRPSVDTQNPDVRIDLHIYENKCDISLDSSWPSLFKRGYRKSQFDSPINEVLAAGLIDLGGWDKKVDFYDPFCGSGTFSTEAYIKASGIHPQYWRSDFGFMRWFDFDEILYNKILNKIYKPIGEIPGRIYASDLELYSMDACKINWRYAKISRRISGQMGDFFQSKPKSENGWIIMNPPYDIRISLDDTARFYRDIGRKLNDDYQGFTAWIISPHTDLIEKINLRKIKSYKVYNGSIECKFVGFEC
ncbi:MAG: THUMP domain-containing protein [Saprospiraceae bacterium]